jgi:hypothetical protein
MTGAKILKTTLFSFVMLVSHLVQAESPIFGNKLGVDYLTLEEVSAQNVTVCIPGVGGTYIYYAFLVHEGETIENEDPLEAQSNIATAKVTLSNF